MRTSRRSLAVLILACAALAGCATHRVAMLPPELESWRQDVRMVDEPPLWPAGAANGYQRRLRLLVTPSLSRQQIAIRIDTTASGKAYAYLTRLEPHPDGGGWEVVEQRRTAIPADELANLDALVAKSNLWKTYPEYWVFGKEANEICLDGVELIVERATADGYRFSEGNAQCTAPRSMLLLAAEMIRLAHSRGSPIEGFLR
jgi:hypothetical protein